MKIKYLLAAAAAVLSLTGCGNTQEVQNKSYLRAVSINKEITAVMAFYSETEENFSAHGNDLEELKDNAEISLGRTLFTGHTEMIVLGDCDYTETLTFLLNEWKISPSCMIISGDESACRNASQTVDSVRRAVEKNEAPECDIVTVLSALLSENGSAEIPLFNNGELEGTKTIHG